MATPSNPSQPWYIFRRVPVSSAEPVDFDSTSNRHVEGNLKGFIYAVSSDRDDVGVSTSRVGLRRKGSSSTRKRRDI